MELVLHEISVLAAPGESLFRLDPPDVYNGSLLAVKSELTTSKTTVHTVDCAYSPESVRRQHVLSFISRLGRTVYNVLKYLSTFCEGDKPTPSTWLRNQRDLCIRKLAGTRTCSDFATCCEHFVCISRHFIQFSAPIVVLYELAVSSSFIRPFRRAFCGLSLGRILMPVEAS
eukprot:513497-Prorocentrum_minimum.AAC.2